VILLSALQLTGSFCGVLFAKSLLNHFHLKRKKNHNELHYAVRDDERIYKPINNELLYDYELMFEQWPNVFEPMGRLEGIESSGVKSGAAVTERIHE
jgi:hypothetical protein